MPRKNTVDRSAPRFDSLFYIENNPDVALCEVNPVRHYQQTGWQERRDPCAVFSCAHYLKQFEDKNEVTNDPLQHYHEQGRSRGLSPHPIFRDLRDKEIKIGCLHFATPSPAAIEKDHVAEIIPLILNDGETDLEALNAAIKTLIAKGCSHIYFHFEQDGSEQPILRALLETGHPFVAPALYSGVAAQTLPASIFNEDTAAKWSQAFTPRLLQTARLRPDHLLIRCEIFTAIGGFQTKAPSLYAALAKFCFDARCLNVVPAIARHLAAPSYSSPYLGQNHFSSQVSFNESFNALPLEDLNVHIVETEQVLLKDKTHSHPLHLQTAKMAFQKQCLAELGKLAENARNDTRHLHRTHLALEKANDENCRYLLKDNNTDEFTSQYRFAWYPDDPCEDTLFLRLAEIFDDATPLLFLAGNHDPLRSSHDDGYIQRIVAIDALSSGRKRLYLNFNANHQTPISLTILSHEVAVLDCCLESENGLKLLSSLLDRMALIYVHSVLAIPNTMLANLLANCRSTLLFDAHGAVPEELAMNDNEEKVPQFRKIEEIIVKRANLIVCVSHAMSAHFNALYGGGDPLKSLILATTKGPSTKAGALQKTANMKGEVPLVLYAGGTQIWQCIPEMATLIMSLKGQADYQILTPNISTFVTALCDAGEDENEAMQRVKTVPYDDIIAYTSQAHFGLLLRQSSTVNKVASPTKLFDYLSNDLVPIVNKSELGDLAHYGFAVCYVDDVLKTGLPDERRRAEMVQENQAILRQLQNETEAAQQQISTIFQTASQK